MHVVMRFQQVEEITSRGGPFEFLSSRKPEQQGRCRQYGDDDQPYSVPFLDIHRITLLHGPRA
jgi:hypothetical protein